MNFKFKNGEVKVNMIEYMTDIVERFSNQVQEWRQSSKLSNIRYIQKDNSKILNEMEHEVFDRTVPKYYLLVREQG